MSLPDELAALHARVGSETFLDPTSFRAAFDDFVGEESATTGELSLLVGAISSGSLQRLLDQLAVDADPGTAIAAQGDLLARDRGTNETGGTRWALSALAFAMGVIPRDSVLTMPLASEAPASVVPPAVPSVGSATSAQTEVTPTATPGPPPVPSEAPGRNRSPLLIAAAAALAVVAVAALFLLFVRDGDSSGPDDDRADGTDDPDRSATSSTGADEEVLAEIDMTDAGKTVRVRLVHRDSAASVVLLTNDGGDYTEVSRVPAGCPFIDTSYDAKVTDQGDRQIYWGWSNNGTEGYGSYGEVQIDEDMVISFEGDDPECPANP